MVTQRDSRCLSLCLARGLSRAGGPRKVYRGAQAGWEACPILDQTGHWRFSWTLNGGRMVVAGQMPPGWKDLGTVDGSQDPGGSES